MTRPEFITTLTPLLLARRTDFDAPTWSAYYQALEDVSHGALARLVRRLAREADHFVPTAGELRAGCVEEQRKILALPEPDRGPWVYYCDVCSDTGWRSFACGDVMKTRQPWLEIRDCQRREPHGSHEWVAICGCAQSNPAVLRKRASTVTRGETSA